MSLPSSYGEQVASQALQRGDAAGAIRVLRESLAKDPKDYRCLVMLAHLLGESGDHSTSAAYAETAARLLPQFVEAHFQLGVSMMRLGRPEAAVRAFGRAAQLRPEIADFHHGLGQALQASGRTSEARLHFERAAKLSPSELQSRLAVANRLLRDDDVYGAMIQARSALAKYPNSIEATLAMAEIAMLSGSGAEAEQQLLRAIAMDPNNSAAYAFLGLRLSHKGDMEDAGRALRRSIELNPLQGFSYLALVQSHQELRGDSEFLAQMESALAAGRLPAQEASSLLFAVAICYEATGEYERSMAAYDEANRLAHYARYGDRVFDGDRYREHLKAIQDLFPTGGLDASPSDLPIFVVGMIRSGTTLVEQILSSHPKVAGAGEVSFWSRHAESPSQMAAILTDPELAAKLVSDYLRQLREVSPEATHVVDKLPSNYQRLGLLRALFPNAKVVHCVRSPIDNALSIYLTPNRSPSAGREAVVFNYRRYQEMMLYWRANLPTGSFLDVQYEHLVSNPAEEIGRLLEFCGLEWNEACLRPEANSREVTTPSLWQVRQPIHSNSMDRWRRFEPYLGVFREFLE